MYTYLSTKPKNLVKISPVHPEIISLQWDCKEETAAEYIARSTMGNFSVFTRILRDPLMEIGEIVGI